MQLLTHLTRQAAGLQTLQASATLVVQHADKVRVVSGQRLIGNIAVDHNGVSCTVVCRRDATQLPDALGMLRRSSLKLQGNDVDTGQAELLEEIEPRGKITLQEERAQMMGNGLRVHRDPEAVALINSRYSAIGGTQWQVPHGSCNRFPQGPTGAHGKPPDPEGRKAVLQAELETQRGRLRQGKYQVLDQAHFLPPGNQRLAVQQVLVADASAQQASIPVHPVAGGKVDHDLADRDGMQSVFKVRHGGKSTPAPSSWTVI